MFIIDHAVPADEAFATIPPERLEAADDAFLDLKQPDCRHRYPLIKR